MTEFQAIVLGLIQGLSEFLPISSSAHLALTPWFFGWEPGGLAFDVALHIGTLIAVAWYFRREWVALARSAVSIVRQRAVRTTEEWRLVFLVAATIPAAIAGLTLEDLAETTFRSPRLIAINLMVMGVVLWAVDRWRGAIAPLDWHAPARCGHDRLHPVPRAAARRFAIRVHDHRRALARVRSAVGGGVQLPDELSGHAGGGGPEGA